MARQTGMGYLKGAVAGRSQDQNPKPGLWTKRDTAAGRFTGVNRSGGAVKDSRRER
jgi:hypothetical protein